MVHVKHLTQVLAYSKCWIDADVDNDDDDDDNGDHGGGGDNHRLVFVSLETIFLLQLSLILFRTHHACSKGPGLSLPAVLIPL